MLRPLCLHPCACTPVPAYSYIGRPGICIPPDIYIGVQVTDEMLDWTGDHLFTNYRDMYIALRQVEYT